MIINAVDKETGNGYIVVKGNFSGSLRANSYVILIVTGLCIISNVPWIIAGIWVPFVYTVLDIGFLVLGLWLTWRACRYQDVIRLASNTVIVEQGHDYPEKRWSYPRQWTKVYYCVNQSLSLPEISIVSSGKGVRIASRANYLDLRRLLRILRRYLPCSLVSQ